MSHNTINPGDRVRLGALEVTAVYPGYVTIRLPSGAPSFIENCNIEEVIPRPLAPGDCVQAKFDIIQIDGKTAWCQPTQCSEPWQTPTFPLPLCSLTRAT